MTFVDHFDPQLLTLSISYKILDRSLLAEAAASHKSIDLFGAVYSAASAVMKITITDSTEVCSAE